MKPKTILTITTLVAGLFGVLLIAIPAQLLTGFGLDAPLSALIQAREGGALLVGLAVLNWLGRDLPPGAALNAILVSDLVGQSLVFLINTGWTLQGAIPWAAYPGVCIHAGLALGYLSALVRLSRK
jgi:hypothetical protein